MASKNRFEYEKQRAIEMKAEEEAMRIRLLNERIDKLDRFPGSLTDYTSLKRESYEIIDTGIPSKEVFVDEPDGYPWSGRERTDTENLAKLLEPKVWIPYSYWFSFE